MVACGGSGHVHSAVPICVRVLLHFPLPMLHCRGTGLMMRRYSDIVRALRLCRRAGRGLEAPSGTASAFGRAVRGVGAPSQVGQANYSRMHGNISIVDALPFTST